MDERPSVTPFMIKGMGMLVNWPGKGVLVVMVKARTTMEYGPLSHRRHKESGSQPPSLHFLPRTRSPGGFGHVCTCTILGYSTSRCHLCLASTARWPKRAWMSFISPDRPANRTSYAQNQHGVQCHSTWMTARNGALVLQSIQWADSVEHPILPVKVFIQGRAALWDRALIKLHPVHSSFLINCHRRQLDLKRMISWKH